MGHTFKKKPKSMNKVLINEPLIESDDLDYLNLKFFEKDKHTQQIQGFTQYKPKNNLTKGDQENVHDLRGIDDFIIYLAYNTFGKTEYVSNDTRILKQNQFIEKCLLNMLVFSDINVHTLNHPSDTIPKPKALWSADYDRTDIDQVVDLKTVQRQLEIDFALQSTHARPSRGIFRGIFSGIFRGIFSETQPNSHKLMELKR